MFHQKKNGLGQFCYAGGASHVSSGALCCLSNEWFKRGFCGLVLAEVAWLVKRKINLACFAELVASVVEAYQSTFSALFLKVDRIRHCKRKISVFFFVCEDDAVLCFQVCPHTLQSVFSWVPDARLLTLFGGLVGRINLVSTATCVLLFHVALGVYAF